MPRSWAQIDVHIVFSTKDRKPALNDDALRDEMQQIPSALSKTQTRTEHFKTCMSPIGRSGLPQSEATRAISRGTGKMLRRNFGWERASEGRCRGPQE